MRSKCRIGLALLAVAVVSAGGEAPLPPTETPVPYATCDGPLNPDGLIGTDWTDQDKAGWIRDQESAMQRCRNDRLNHAATFGF
jgi:hypothetical protein